MIRSIIIDDERLARQELKKMLEDYGNIQIVAECGNANEAIRMIEKEKPDLIFLDIQMPGKNGFELLQSLSGNVPDVIFITAYDEYAINAFEVSALDYVLKPIDEERLKTAISKLSNEQEKDEPDNGKEERLSGSDQVFVKDGEKCWFVKLEDVRLFESEGNYIRVYFDGNKPLILKSLNNLDKRLNEKEFFRASRKHIINLKWVENAENWFNGGLQVTLRGGEKVQISRRQAVRLKDMMSL